MSIKVCTSGYMISTVEGLGFGRSWFPRAVNEAFLQSTKDGDIKRSPDPVEMINDGVTWVNNTADPQMVVVQVQRAPRMVVVQSPATVLIHDAWSFDTGENPTAEYPSVRQDSFGGGLQINRSSTAAADLSYCRQFFEIDASEAFVPVGQIDPLESLHFRYVASVQTPGVWTTPSEFEPRWEADALWARLVVLAGPVGSL